MAASRNLTIADGQVAATATEITAGPSNQGARVNVVFHNTGSTEETLILTLTRGTDGTARRVKRVVLKENESCDISGLPMNGTDSLKAVTTTASTVDYVVSVGPEDSPYTFAVYDENGVPKSVPDTFDQLIQSNQ
jgi:hypothetical protein